MQNYLDLMSDVLRTGEIRADRTGVGTRSLFARQLRFDLAEGFPAVTTKRLHFKAVVAELLWILSGSTNVRPLQAQGVRIWNEWADASGELGPVYGEQWRSWGPTNIDQITDLVYQIKHNPMSRRLIVSAWNVADVPRMALPPCHCLFQFYVSNAGALSCQLYQRSADIFLGVPFNIASYALLTHMLAQVCDLKVGEFVHTFGDVHLYSNHEPQALAQLAREPHPAPRLMLDPNVRSIFDFAPESIQLEGYKSHAALPALVAV